MMKWVFILALTKGAKEVLATRDRRAAVHSADACGLYFTNVYYPPIYQLPLPLNSMFFTNYVNYR